MGEVREFKAGWSVARLATEFGMDRKTVARRIRDANVPPAGKRSGYDVYRLADVAAVLVGVSVSFGDDGTIDPRNLPPSERRAYYQSENERIKVEVSTGALVPAAEVEADYADLVKTLVQFFDTLPDVLERDCSLSPEQVIRVQEACDQVRQGMYEKVIESDVRDSA
jgi:hypothetical protein